jgi:hypothetical protein
MPTQGKAKNQYPTKTAIRVIANIIIAAGVLLFFLVLYNAASDSIPKTLFKVSADSSIWILFAIGISLPVPLHVISIGLFLQKKWLPPRWVIFSWIAIVLSGCWLGVAFLVKLFFIK